MLLIAGRLCQLVLRLLRAQKGMVCIADGHAIRNTVGYKTALHRSTVSLLTRAANCITTLFTRQHCS